MKKAVNIIEIIYTLLLFYLTKDSDILPLTISFSMYMLYKSLFSNISIKSNNHKIFKYSIILFISVAVPLSILSYLIGDLLNINKLNIINIFMTWSLITNLLLKIIREYLENINYKKLSNKIITTYKFIKVTLKIVITILLFGILKTKSYINIIVLYSIDILVFMIIGIILYLVIFKNIKENTKDKINYLKETKNILINNKIEVIYNIINNSYIYISIIILYYVLTNKYNYTYMNVSSNITNVYLYGLITIYYIYLNIKKYLNINYKDNFNNNLNKVIKVSLTISILLTIISRPLSYLIFNSNTNILSNLIPLLFIYIIYDFVINTNIIYNKEKNIITMLIIGLITKTVFELPLINTIYRMGYSLTLGSVLSIVLGLTIPTIVGIILVKNKQKLSLMGNFNDLLNIIYENIIYTLVLVLLMLIIKTNTKSLIASLLVVIFYIFITIIFYIVKLILKKK